MTRSIGTCYAAGSTSKTWEDHARLGDPPHEPLSGEK